MFNDFLYLLRRSGLKISLTEWTALMEGLDKGLHESSFIGFYHLCRCLLVKSEADFDLFDRCFLEYFDGVSEQPELLEELLRWLDETRVLQGEFDEQQAQLNQLLPNTEIEFMFQERRNEQKSQHNCGNYWIGTKGMSVFGNTGMSPNGILVGGGPVHKCAFRVAGERRFRDFRRDNTLDTRQFQMALRHLRQFSGLVDLPPTQFDVDNTVKDTAGSAGMLKVRYKRPRENTIKVLLLIDSGGSMDYYSQLCSALFQAVSKSRHFKDLKIYYFHNCIYTRLYTDPVIDPRRAVSSDWVLSSIPDDYKVIFVGDAQMSPHELLFHYAGSDPNGPQCGLEQLKLIRSRWRSIIWLNPSDRPEWGAEWTESYDAIAKLFPMFPLTLEGLEEGLKKLLNRT